MKEYLGKSASNFEQSPAKKYSLLQAINRVIPVALPNATLLDVGCGKGELFPLFNRKGYIYFGADISEDMLKLATQQYPEGKYFNVSATDLTRQVDKKFDVVVANMLFTVMDNQEAITGTLLQCKELLKQNGIMVIGVAHPCFDAYMQAQLDQREGIEADFKGYYASGNRYTVQKKYSKGLCTLEDYHWTLTDYFEAILRAGFQITQIDECKPEVPIDFSDQDNWGSNLSGLYPPYLVFVCT